MLWYPIGGRFDNAASGLNLDPICKSDDAYLGLVGSSRCSQVAVHKASTFAVTASTPDDSMR
jgi:hypothetical protein